MGLTYGAYCIASPPLALKGAAVSVGPSASGGGTSSWRNANFPVNPVFSHPNG